MILLLLLALLQAKAPAPAQAPPDPEIERKSFQMAEGFEVNLFAADPLLAKPIQMNWDARGRLWVATSTTYPQVLPGESPNDKILILEDKDGDGRAETSTVFADGLFIPTGLEVGHGGAYVANSTELLHLADTDGDGKADRRRVVLAGFGTEDTHHIIHTFRWGPDGDLYFNQSIYIHSHIETPYGPRRLGGAGFWRFRPASRELEVFAKGLCNPWGHTFDRYGRNFGTDGAGSEGIHYLMPGAMYTHFPSGERLFQGLNQGQPKFCAHEIVASRHYPDAWQGRFVVNDFRANRLIAFQVTEDGAGFSAKPVGDLLKTTDRAFRPIDIRHGPDGALYVADWYNPIINHGEVGFRDPRRDKVHGRIWRITARDRPLVARPKLHDASVPELLEQLKAPEDWTRHFARRVLAERDPSTVLPDLVAWTRAQTDEPALLEGLWTFQTLDVPDAPLLRRLLEAADGRVRAAAARVAGRWHARLENPVALLAPRAVDPHPLARLEAVRALKEVGSAAAFAAAIRALDQPVDRFLDYSLWLTAYEMRAAWLPEFEAGRLAFPDAKHADFALRAVKSPLAAERVIDQVKAGWQSLETRENALNLLVASGTADDLRKLFAGTFDARMLPKVLAGLARAARERGVRPAGELGKLKGLLSNADPAVADEAHRLAGLWKLEALRPDLEKAAAAGGRAAVDGLAALGGDSAFFFKRLAAEGDAKSKSMAVAGLALLDLPAAAALAGGALEGDPADVFSAFLSRKGGAEALAAALDPKKIPADAARLGLRHMYAAGRAEPALVAVLNGALGLVPKRAELSPEELKSLAARALAEGDPVRGEAVFRRKELSCFQCHAVAGAGGSTGPDLLSLGSSAPPDYIVESILRPEAKSKEGFVSLQVLTKSGDVLSGIRVRESADELILRDAIRDEISIPKKSIQAQKTIGSIMPAGLADLLTEAELLDLVRFLSELGKPGPWQVGAAPAVRRWRVKQGELWLPAYSGVSGTLPADAWAGAARAEVEVVTAGKFRLRLDSAEGRSLEIDGKPVPAAAEVDVDWDRGVHAVVVSGPAAPLRLEIEEAPGSPGRLRILGGK
jgi:putative heme-binding domain-containing protein